jgi:anti-sigma regulatory factor (Ser/Thr protein kinase)
VTQRTRECHPWRLRRDCGPGYGRALADQRSQKAGPAVAAGPLASVALHLDSRPDSPMTARHSLVDLESTLDPETMAKLRLLVTELVANSVRHARGTPIDVKVTVHERIVRTDVSDGGDGFEPPAQPDPNPLKSSGWGLFLVRRIATRWGADSATGTVWFEIERGDKQPSRRRAKRG